MKGGKLVAGDVAAEEELAEPAATDAEILGLEVVTKLPQMAVGGVSIDTVPLPERMTVWTLTHKRSYEVWALVRRPWTEDAADIPTMSRTDH